MSFFGGIFDYVSSPFKSPEQSPNASATSSQLPNDSFVTTNESPEPPANTSTGSTGSDKENRNNVTKESYKLNCYNPNESFKSALEAQGTIDDDVIEPPADVTVVTSAGVVPDAMTPTPQRKAPRPTMDHSQFTDYVDQVVQSIVDELLDDIEMSDATGDVTYDAKDDRTFDVRNDISFGSKENLTYNVNVSFSTNDNIEHLLKKPQLDESVNQSFDNRQTIVPKTIASQNNTFEKMPENKEKLQTFQEDSFFDSRITVLPNPITTTSDTTPGNRTSELTIDLPPTLGDVEVIESPIGFDRIKTDADRQKELKSILEVEESSETKVESYDESILASAPGDKPIDQVDDFDDDEFTENIDNNAVKHSTPVTENRQKPAGMRKERIESELDLEVYLKKKEEIFIKQLKGIEAETARAKSDAKIAKQQRDDLEKTISQLKCFSEECRKQSSDIIAQLTKVQQQSQASTPVESIEQIKSERAAAIADNRAIENAFADLNGRYQTLREAENKFREEELILRDKCHAMEKRLTCLENNTALGRKLAEQKLEKANEEIERLLKARDTDTIGLRVAVKKSELQIDTLQRTIDQKAREFDELTNLCDELIGRQEGSETETEDN